MGKLHEILAVEGELQNTASKIIDETFSTFNKKPHLFTGFKRVLEHLVDGYTDVPEEHQQLATTVYERLDYTFGHVAKLLDATYQKELANSEARADIVIDGSVIAKNIPATYLLNLEKRLANLRPMLAAIPTLPQGAEFELAPDEGENIYKMVHPEIKMRTAKSFKSKVVAPATDRHPAQVEKWEEPMDIGRFIKTFWLGSITAADKSNILKRVDELICSVKQARQRANTVEVPNEKIGKILMDYVLG